MLHPSTKRLIDKLNEMTRKQRVAWSEGEDGTITHDTEGYRVVLTPEPHAVLLTDALGKEIESCTPEEFADETDGAGRPYATFVAELYREAHRHARGAEKAINTVLKGLESTDAEPEEAPEPALDPADLVEDPGDDTDAFPEAYPELEGQTDMARAVASMAEEVNGGGRSAEPEAESAHEIEPGPEYEAEEEAETVATEPETVIASEPEPETPTEPETIAPSDPESDIEAAEDTPEEVTSDALEAFEYTPAFATAPEPESTSAPIETETPLWPEDDNAPVVETAPEPVLSEPEPEAQPEPAPTPTATMASPFGSGYFGSGTGGLSQYTSSTPVATEPETAPEPAPEANETIAPDVEYAADISSAAPEVELPEDPPVTAEMPAAQPEPQRFSLSGMSSGFGLGAAGRAGSAQPEPSAASGAPAMDSPRMVIDGTVDLPDDIDLSEFNAGPDTPAYTDPLTDAESAPFTFSDQADTPPEPPEPSRPEEAAFEVPAETVEPGTSEPEPEEAPPPPKPPTRFNPWN
ncbi:hypothetical protein [Hyphomonas chukchiensis]|uniref:hypothetical protein n=1 Tax=Hyphomonas chukchiensis TaxID=1280947 RepID=UPI0030F73ED6